MGLTILHSADWHLDSPFTGFPDAQQAYLKEELKKLPGKIADLCRRESCQIVLLAGDLFDGPWTRDTAELLRRALGDMEVPVFITPGNHDYLSPESPWLTESWPENVHIFTRELESVSLPELDCRVYGAGYRSMDCPGLLKNFRAEGEETYKIAVLHGDPMQVRSPYCPVTASQVRDSGLGYLALGHIHKGGSFRAGKTLCGWPGCPMGRGYDETREKGVYILELDQRARARFVPLDTPQFYDLETDISALDDLLPPVADRNFYRIRLTGSGGETLKALRARYAGFPHLQLIDERTPERDLWEAAEGDTLEGTYFRLLREKLENAEPEQAARIRLAAEISRRLLEGRTVELP